MVFVLIKRCNFARLKKERTIALMEFNVEELLEESGIEGGSIQFVSNIDLGEKHKLDCELKADELIPVLPLKNVMLFPYTMLPIGIGRKSSLALVNEAYESGQPVGVFSQVDDNENNPNYDTLYRTGVLAKIVRVLNLPGGAHTAILQGYDRVRLIDLQNGGRYMMGHLEMYPEIAHPASERDYNAVIEALREATIKYMRSNESLVGHTLAISNITESETLINFICANIPIDNKERILLLECDNLYERAQRLLYYVQREYQFAKLKQSIRRKTHEELNKQQRDYFLRQEMENIQEQLGEKEENSDLQRLLDEGENKNWPEEIAELFDREADKLARINRQSPDYQLQYSYLETLVRLPWNEFTQDNLDLNNAERVLNRDHYGMEKVKERILEHLAVLRNRGDMKSPIICLYGPPGVGKTSLGKSIAKAMKRKYVRVSLGGLHDESEIRGHRRTYIGAMPGRIIKNILKAGSSNPVFILDEIDKITQQNVNGDPASALLEVLDPEQNTTFHDNYLDCNYDLSNVMFIATANNISNIPAPLLDRMELIEVSGYLTEEKIEIARRHLVPKTFEDMGMPKDVMKFHKKALEYIIEKYTRESGVRGLEKNIGKIMRKILLEYTRTEVEPNRNIKVDDVARLLGTEPYNRDKYQGNDYYGVVTGLAWTSVGGEILFVETSINETKAGKLTLTGNLGDVMKESAAIALQYLKANPQLLGEAPQSNEGKTWTDFFETHNIHMHVPEGATPKDGPSAGITIATSMASAIMQRKVRAHLAMTGEITLRGKVLPVGGIKEKILAAKRAGITDIIICHENRKNIEDIPQQYVKGVTFHYVENVSDVLQFALI